MKFGLCMFVTDYSMHPADLGREAEARGFESLWFPEHTHIPASRATPAPGGMGELPREYWHTQELFVALAMAATATTQLKVASGICLVVERDPILLAKTVASLDALSGGRFLFGIGGGWNVEEMANHGTDFKKRWHVLRERVEAMKAIWTSDNAEYHGQFVNFDPIWSWPKPLQKPHPPIYLGGHGTISLKRVVRYCDGWMPIPMRAGDLGQQIRELHDLARKAGRDPTTLTVTTFMTPPDADLIRSYRDMGVHRVVLGLPPGQREEVLPLMDRHRALMQEIEKG